MTTFRWPRSRLEFVISDGKVPPPIPILLRHWSLFMGAGKHLSLYKSSNSCCTEDFSQMRQAHGNTQYLQLLGGRHFHGQDVGDVLSSKAVSSSIKVFLALPWFPVPQIKTRFKTKPDFHCHCPVGLAWAPGQSHPTLCTCSFLEIKDTASEKNNSECSRWSSLALVGLQQRAQIILMGTFTLTFLQVLYPHLPHFSKSLQMAEIGGKKRSGCALNHRIMNCGKDLQDNKVQPLTDHHLKHLTSTTPQHQVPHPVISLHF